MLSFSKRNSILFAHATFWAKTFMFCFVGWQQKPKTSFCSRANNFKHFLLFLNLRRISDFMFRPKHSSQGSGGRVHPFDGNFPSFPPLFSFKKPTLGQFPSFSFLLLPIKHGPPPEPWSSEGAETIPAGKGAVCLFPNLSHVHFIFLTNVYPTRVCDRLFARI